MIAGCYVLDLQCDNAECGEWLPRKAQFTAESGGACRKAARDAGWRLDLANGSCLCRCCFLRQLEATIQKCGGLAGAARSMKTSRSQLRRLLAHARGAA